MNFMHQNHQSISIQINGISHIIFSKDDKVLAISRAFIYSFSLCAISLSNNFPNELFYDYFGNVKPQVSSHVTFPTLSIRCKSHLLPLAHQYIISPPHTTLPPVTSSLGDFNFLPSPPTSK